MYQIKKLHLKKFCLFSFILACMIICSCNSKDCYYHPDNVVLADSTNIADTLRGEALQPKFGTISELYYVNERLIALTDKSSQFFQICKPEVDTCVISFGEYGHSRDEFIDMPLELYIKKHNNGHDLYLSDNNGRITKIIDFEASIANKKPIVRKIIKHPHEKTGYDYHIFYLASDKYTYYKELSYNDARDNIYFPPEYGFCSPKETLVKKIYPTIIPTSDNTIRSIAYAGKTEISPNSQKIVLMHHFTDILDIVDNEHKTITGVMHKGSISFDYFLEINSFDSMDMSVNGFNIDVSVTDNHIFVLKTYMTIKEILEGEAIGDVNYKPFLVIYDWNGNALQKMVIDNGLRSIAYNEGEHILYGVDDNGTLFKYNLSSYIK